MSLLKVKILSAIFFVNFSLLNAYPMQVLISQGGENYKNQDQNFELTIKGKKRAAALPYLLMTDSRFFVKAPKFLIAASPEKNNDLYVKFLNPFSKLLEIDTNDKYSLGKEDTLAQFILNDTSLEGQTVFIAWAPEKIDALLKTLKINEVQTKWSQDIFDRIYVISYDTNGNASITDQPQRLLFDDQAK